MKKRMLPDVLRVATMVTAASVLLFCSTPLARLLGEPALASWGMFAGLAVYACAVSHALRRAYFPYIDLRDFAYAARTHPVGAAIVFAGVCYVLGSLVQIMGGLVHG